VFCRVKPLEEYELELTPEDEVSCVRFPQKVLADAKMQKELLGDKINHQTIELLSSKYMAAGLGGNGKYLYNFDGVFLPEQG